MYKRFIANFFVNTLIVNMLYMFIILILPYVLVLLGNKTFDLKPDVFGYPLFKAYVGNGVISSEVTILGIILATTIALIFTFFIEKRRK